MSKKYIIVAPKDVDNDRVSEFLDAQSLKGNLKVIFNGYAPRLWFISYNGSTQQLADVLWPDGFEENEFAIKEGFVVQIVGKTINGWADEELWELLADGSD
ncbi:MAG: hypothetical protein OXF23_05350 [Candidatus Dadabacteria bacterium]|nr:hypothetical protein [Candidatus Dadabacteria bacterium]